MTDPAGDGAKELGGDTSVETATDAGAERETDIEVVVGGFVNETLSVAEAAGENEGIFYFFLEMIQDKPLQRNGNNYLLEWRFCCTDVTVLESRR